MSNIYGKLKKGDKIVVTEWSGDYKDNLKNNPNYLPKAWGVDGTYVYATVRGTDNRDGEIYLTWSEQHTSGGNYRMESIYEQARNRGAKVVMYKDAPKKPIEVIKIDHTHLDRLVIKNEAKEDIISVLSQHEHSTKIFDEWGLGELIEYGRGMTMMFHGLPGTGKTFGANLIAKSLGKELLVINAANIQSSEPGAANRNIQDAFKEASDNGKILFMDECDSLIYNRKNLGMVLASEVNTLLTEIEQFEGVCILATNRVEHMDPALERRIALIVEFEAPDKAMRVDIWKGLLPEKMPLSSCVDIEALASHEMTGALIKNAVLQGARLAAADHSPNVTSSHFNKAIERIAKSQNKMGTNNQQMAKVNGRSGPSGGVSTSTAVGKVKVSTDEKMASFMDALSNKKEASKPSGLFGKIFS